MVVGTGVKETLPQSMDIGATFTHNSPALEKFTVNPPFQVIRYIPLEQNTGSFLSEVNVKSKHPHRLYCT